jgi:hypothetical protein
MKKYVVFKQGNKEAVANTERNEIIADFYIPGAAEQYISFLNSVEGIKEEDSRPSHWKTGLKLIHNVEHYQTHCKCPNCKNAQTKFLSRWTRTTVCVECSFDLSVQVATDEFGKRDDYGNFFVAYRLG